MVVIMILKFFAFFCFLFPARRSFLQSSVQEKLGETGSGIFVNLFAIFVNLVGDKEGFETGWLVGDGFEHLVNFFFVCGKD